jgi:hypothetical protein
MFRQHKKEACMPQTLSQIATISLLSIAAVFVFVGFIRFRLGRLNEHNSTSTYGTLVGFRRYYTSDQWGDSGEDYADNKPGRVPIVRIRIDGEEVDIAAVSGNATLSRTDIGKQVKVRYRELIGITLVVDSQKSLHNYNQLQNTLFVVFMCVGAILFILGVLAHFVLPEILGSL